MSIKKEFIEEFGFVKYKSLFSNDFIDRLNLNIDLLQKSLVNTNSEEVFFEGNTKKIKQIQYLYKYDSVFNELLFHIPDIIRDIYGTPIKYSILNIQLFEKHAGISKPTRNHQDNAYFKLKHSDFQPITIWISLDEINKENGCLFYSMYSHLNGTLLHNRYSKNTTFRVRSGVPGLSLCLNKSYDANQIPVYTNPGDVLVHFSNTIHRAGANTTTDKRRRAIGIVIIPDTCIIDPILMKWHKKMLAEDLEILNSK